MKQKISLTESQLNKIIKNCVNEALLRSESPYSIEDIYRFASYGQADDALNAFLEMDRGQQSEILISWAKHTNLEDVLDY